jgi:hypothetical protein
MAETTHRIVTTRTAAAATALITPFTVSSSPHSSQTEHQWPSKPKEKTKDLI